MIRRPDDMTVDYQERLDFLYGRLNYEWLGMPKLTEELRLGRMRKLLRLLGDPHESLRIIHVAGTKGKGSTSVMIAAALTASGLRTGLFCSPHLHRLEERFRIDGEQASAEELIALTDAVRPAVEKLDEVCADSRYRGPTFFEITTAMGLLHFARKNTGAVVLEVGMGGRLDSTNVVHPELSVVTTISFDHTRQLGSTLAAIAGEKAGIFKRDRPAVSGVIVPEARDVIRQAAAQRRCPLRELDRDFHYQFKPPQAPLTRPAAGRVVVETWRTQWGEIELPLMGAHQAGNAAVALASLDVLAEHGWNLGRDAVVRGFAGLSWPARVEVLGEAPCLVVDSSHNVASAEALGETLQSCFPASRRTLIFGTSRDKDLRGQLQALLPLFDEVIVTRYLENPRATSPEEVARVVEEIDGRAALVTSDPTEALAVARRRTPADGLICVTGSLFLAAEARSLILNEAAEPAIGQILT